MFITAPLPRCLPWKSCACWRLAACDSIYDPVFCDCVRPSLLTSALSRGAVWSASLLICCLEGTSSDAGPESSLSCGTSSVRSSMCTQHSWIGGHCEYGKRDKSALNRELPLMADVRHLSRTPCTQFLIDESRRPSSITVASERRVISPMQILKFSWRE
jgi:hypothetical protein